jgi:nucleotidyltransferase substrate binding protein (TIGR01987 family)
MNNEDRWKQRFENFERSYATFQRMLTFYTENSDQEVSQMAVTQAFEINVELAWKVMKDFLENEGFEINSPKDAVRQAFQSDIIQGENGEIWMEALKLRNLTSHTYEKKTLNLLLDFISGQYPEAVSKLHGYFKGKS